MKEYNLTQIKKILKKILNPARYNHSCEVAYIAKNLAKIHKQNIHHAETAGLIHDCAKHLEPTDFKKYGIDTKKIPNYNFIISKTPKVLHSYTGVQFASKVFKIKDKNILSAIKKHTTGSQNMSTMDKIIYIADVLDPARKFKQLDKIKKYAYTDLDKALLFSVKMKLKNLITKKRYICKDTVEMWNKFVG
jgi:predicted HD superfamily hydrolase involved in NAD metabolism